MKSNHILSGVSALGLVVAVHGSGCASQANSPDFLSDDGGSTGQTSGSSGGSSSGNGTSGSGGGSGAASSSGGGATSSSGSSSSGAGSSTSSGGSKADAGSACVGTCKSDLDCQNSCGAVRSGYVWCCGSSTCYPWSTACPVQTDGGSSSGTSSSSSGSSSSGAGTDAGVSDAVCQAMGTSAACQQCCATNHMHGYNTYINSLMSCACGTSGVCKTPCASEFCASTPTTMGDACETCLNNSLSADAGGTCLTPVTNACVADSDCLALLGTTGCVSGCP